MQEKSKNWLQDIWHFWCSWLYIYFAFCLLLSHDNANDVWTEFEQRFEFEKFGTAHQPTQPTTGQPTSPLQSCPGLHTIYIGSNEIRRHPPWSELIWQPPPKHMARIKFVQPAGWVAWWLGGCWFALGWLGGCPWLPGLAPLFSYYYYLV